VKTDLLGVNGIKARNFPETNDTLSYKEDMTKSKASIGN
jgi:hypothetical protein